MTNYEAIMKMSKEELAYFFAATEVGANDIPNLDVHDIQHYIDYLNRETNILEYIKEHLKALNNTSKTVYEQKSCKGCKHFNRRFYDHKHPRLLSFGGCEKYNTYLDREPIQCFICVIKDGYEAK